MMPFLAAVTLWVLVIGTAEHILSGPVQTLMAVFVAAVVLWEAAKYAWDI